MNLVAGVETPTGGDVVLAGHQLAGKDEDERARIRRGLGAGLVIATAAGARRTDDAVARYRAAAEVFDVWVGRNKMSPAAFARVEKLPHVARAMRSVDVAFWGRNDTGRAVTVKDVELNAPINGPDAGHERTKYLARELPARRHRLLRGSLGHGLAQGCRRPPEIPRARMW